MFVRPTAGGAVLPLKQERRFSDLVPASPSDLQIRRKKKNQDVRLVRTRKKKILLPV